MYRKSEQGHSIFETVIILPVLVGVILGAADISHVMRSYSALQEGMNTAVRCLYTVEGECVASNVTGPRDPLYDVTVYDVTNPFVSSYFSYSGEERFIAKPSYNYSGFQAQILDNVFYDRDSYSHFAKRQWFPATGEIPGPTVNIMESRSPYVTGTSPENVSFRYLIGGGSYSNNLPVQTQNTSGISCQLNGTGNVSCGQFRFRVNNPHTTGTCKISESFDQDAAQHVGSVNPCQPADSTSGNAVVWIRGSVSGDSGSHGTVAITLDGPGANNRSLGGRHMFNNAGASGNFVPRGAPASYVQPSFASSFAETISYPIRVTYGQWYWVSFDLSNAPGQTTNGVFQWDFDSVRIRAPRFSQGPDGTQQTDCIGGLLPSENNNPAACTTNPPSTVISAQITGTTPLPDSANGEVPTLIHESESSSINFVQALNTANMAPQQDWVYDGYQSSTVSEQVQCPTIGQGNVGVSEQANPQTGLIESSPAAQSICPPSHTSAANIRWSERQTSIPGNLQATWTRDHCNHQPNPVALIPQLGAYPKLIDGVLSFNGPSEEKIHTGPESTSETDPYHVVVSSSLYNCNDLPGGFQAAATTYDEHYTSEGYPEGFPADSLFRGLHDHLGCDYASIVRTHAETLELPTNAWFATHEPHEASGSVNPLSSQPDSCVPYRLGEGERSNPQHLGLHPETALPPICSQQGKVCELQFAGFQGGGGAKVEFDIETARDLALSEIRAGNPKAKSDCTGADCYDISFTSDADSILVDGQVSVPLNLLLGSSIDLRMSREETFESEFARR